MKCVSRLRARPPEAVSHRGCRCAVVGRRALSLAGLLAAAPGVAAAADFEHALIIIADDLGTDKVTSYAGDVYNPTETRPSTPNIDALASSGVRFSDAWASPVCSVTRASLYTGEHPFRTGVGSVIGENEIVQMPTTPSTLAQLAQDAGVATALFGKSHIGEDAQTPNSATSSPIDHPDYPIQAGFEWFQGNTDGKVLSYTAWLYMQSLPDAGASSGYYTTAAQNRTKTPTNQTTDDALAWLDDRSAAGERRLAVVSYHIPHNTGTTQDPTWISAVTSCGGTSTGDETANQELVVQCFDAELAELLAGVPDLEDTLIVLLGDNGTPKQVAEGYFDDDRGKSTLYENGLRVPFVVADGAAVQDMIDNGWVMPTGGAYRVEGGITSGDPATTVDVFATIADYLDLSSSDCEPGVSCGRDSVSLRPALEGGPSDRSFTWSELYDLDGDVPIGDGVLRMGDYKLIVHVNSATAPCRGYDLFDLVADRWETTDLYDDEAYADVREALLTQLDVIAADMAEAGIADWLGHADCDACGDEIWYDGFDSSCDTASDFDQDLDGVEWPEDCEDTEPTAFPGGTETPYDGVDGDCSGGSDFDVDLDTFDVPEDCDDTRADVWPGAAETPYDGVDADCLGDSDFDADGDGFDSADWAGTDCDDDDASIWPGAPEVPGDGVDSDCDGAPEVFDADGDGSPTGVDCDDADASAYPGAVEIPYDGVDQDCLGGDDFDVDGDGQAPLAWGGADCDDAAADVYDSAPETWYDGIDQDCDAADDFDQDGDGYASSAWGGTDCADTNVMIRPGARETWYDGVDQNCDGRNDYDRDGDGYPSTSYGGTDCDDTRSAVKPGATEIWYDGVDQNCDGADDFDRDGDGWPRATDCNDGNRRAYPGAPGWTLECTRI